MKNLLVNFRIFFAKTLFFCKIIDSMKILNNCNTQLIINKLKFISQKIAKFL